MTTTGAGLRAEFDEFSEYVDRVGVLCALVSLWGVLLFINPRYSAGDAGDDVAGDGSGAGCQFTPGDVGSQNFGSIPGLYIIQMGDIHHNLIHGYTPQYRAVGAVQVNACAGIGKVVQVSVSEPDADGSHAGGSCGDVGVVVGNPMVAGKGAYQGDTAVEGQCVA